MEMCKITNSLVFSSCLFIFFFLFSDPLILYFLLPCVVCDCDSDYTADHIFTMKYCGLTEVPTNISAETKQVGLSHNKIADIKAGAFSHLKNCTVLMLSYNKLSRIRRDMFRGLKSLRDFRLSHNKIAQIQHGSFAGLHLTHLYLLSNQITKLEQSDAYKSRHLTLFLGENPLQCDWRICWIKKGEQDGWITLSKGENSKPHCANSQDIPWDSITGFCSVTGKGMNIYFYILFRCCICFGFYVKLWCF